MLGIMLGSVCVPLDPGLPADDLDRVIRRVEPAMILADLDRTPCIPAARRKVQVLDFPPGGIRGGRPCASSRLSELDPSKSKDEALILCTSGTAGAPKLVSHTHGGLLWCAATLAEHLHLNSGSRTLNPVPLTYSHGLVAATLSSLAGQVQASYATRRPIPRRSFRSSTSTSRRGTSWSPTVHQAIVRHAEGRGGGGGSWPLEFVSSAGAAMPERARIALEEVFGVPVIERYAQTESPIVCNGLTDDYRVGTVGRPIGCELALLNDDAVLVGSEAMGECGEILVRGPWRHEWIRGGRGSHGKCHGVGLGRGPATWDLSTNRDFFRSVVVSRTDHPRRPECVSCSGRGSLASTRRCCPHWSSEYLTRLSARRSSPLSYLTLRTRRLSPSCALFAHSRVGTSRARSTSSWWTIFHPARAARWIDSAGAWRSSVLWYLVLWA